jgi:PPOX class probable F420-dependent enzyme
MTAATLPGLADLAAERRAHVRKRLETDVIAWLTTVRPSGQPDSVPVWYLWADARILVYSRPNTPKLRNLATNPRATLALDDTRAGFDVVRVEGEARHVPTHPGLDELPDYVAKYADLMRRIGYGSPRDFAEDFSEAIVLTPTRLRA